MFVRGGVSLCVVLASRYLILTSGDFYMWLTKPSSGFPYMSIAVKKPPKPKT